MLHAIESRYPGIPAITMSKPPKPTKLRCFVGLKFALHDQIKPLLEDLKIRTEDKSSKLRIVPPENLHITIKFLGSVGRNQLNSIRALLSELSGKHQQHELHCQGIGFFKNSIWVGIHTDHYLNAIATEMNMAFVSLGFNAQQKKYVPHVTVARFNRDARIKLSTLLEIYSGKIWGIIPVKEILLFKSDTLPEGARYSILDNYKLADVS